MERRNEIRQRQQRVFVARIAIRIPSAIHIRRRSSIRRRMRPSVFLSATPFVFERYRQLLREKPEKVFTLLGSLRVRRSFFFNLPTPYQSTKFYPPLPDTQSLKHPFSSAIASFCLGVNNLDWYVSLFPLSQSPFSYLISISASLWASSPPSIQFSLPLSFFFLSFFLCLLCCPSVSLSVFLSLFTPSQYLKLYKLF